MEAYWRLDMSVPLDEVDWGEANRIVNNIEPSDDAGTGFGFRDFGWVFNTQEEAEELKTKLIEAFTSEDVPSKKVAGWCSVEFYDVDDEEESEEG